MSKDRKTKPLSELEAVPPIVRTFLNGALERNRLLYIYRRDVKHYLDAVAFPERALEKLHTLVKALNKYSVTPQTATNPRVQQGYEVLSEFTRRVHPILSDTGAVVFVYGSMRYDDPVNLDYDLKIVTDRHSPGLKWLYRDWTDELDDEWKTLGPDGNLTYLSIEQLEHHCRAIADNDTSYVYKNAGLIDFEFGGASIVFSGYPLYAADSSLVPRFQQQVVQLTSNTPLLTGAMIVELSDVLKVRRERRKQPRTSLSCVLPPQTPPKAPFGAGSNVWGQQF